MPTKPSKPKKSPVHQPKKESHAMSTKSSKSTKSSVHHANHEEGSTMSTHPTKIDSTVLPVAVTETAPVATPSPGPTGPAPALAGVSNGAPAAAVPTGAVPRPPADAKIPAPPPGYAPAIPGEFKAVVPRKSELSALPLAITNLSRFTDYDALIGGTAPSLAEVVEALTAGNEWTTTCQATTAWGKYASLMQGLAWQVIRTQLESLRPAFALAAKRNPSLAEKYTGLAKLLAVPTKTAQQGAVTKKANKKDVAEGKLPSHGKVGKKATKAAQKAALLEKQAAGAATQPSLTPAPVVAQNGSASASPTTGAAPAAPTAPAATNGVGNTGH